VIVNLTFDAGLDGPLEVDWTLSGDDYGDPPHAVSGTLQIMHSNPDEMWLSVEPQIGSFGNGTQSVEICYNSLGLDPGAHFASLVINHNGGLSPITIPVTLNVGPDHDPAAIIAVDKSGSMSLTDAYGVSRLERARELAHIDIINLLADSYMVAVMEFNADGINLTQDFTDNSTELHDAVDAVGLPRHDTPLAAAMCQAHCQLHQLGCGIDALYTYTDGEENESLNFDMCYICDYCYRYHSSGWNYNCDPANPGSCTDWQMCLAEVFANNGMTVVNYFGSPINPFNKGTETPEDMFFLKYTADASDGEFNYYADAAFIPGDANGDGGVNVSDAVWIVNYVFVGGDPPQPLESADSNCDSMVNVSDAVFLINYVFVGGEAPQNCE